MCNFSDKPVYSSPIPEDDGCFVGIAINKDGIIYVADGPNIRLITTDGKIKTLIGSQEKLKKWTPMPCDKIMSADTVRVNTF